MPARIEIGELVDAVEHLGDELPEIEARRDAGASAEPSGDAAREVGDVGVVHDASDPGRVRRLLGEEVADAATDRGEGLEVEALQADLDGPRIVEAGVGGEVRVEPLRERRKALDALRSVEEGRRCPSRRGRDPDSARHRARRGAAAAR